MDQRKGKRKKEREANETPRGSTRKTVARARGAHGGGDGRSSAGASGASDIAGQNAPPPAAIADRPPGRPMGQQLAAAPGGSTPRHGVHSPGLGGQAQDSGSWPPPTRRLCPVCHRPAFSDDFCVYCVSEAAQAMLHHRLPPPRPPLPLPPPPQPQERPHDPYQYMAMAASRPIGQQRGGAPRGPPATQNLRPGVQAGPQQAHPVPRAGDPFPAPSAPPRPQHQPQPPPSAVVGALQLQQLQRMAEQAAATTRPAGVGQRGGAPGERLAAQLGLLGLQRPPQPMAIPAPSRPPRPEQNPQAPPPAGAGAQHEQQLQHMAQEAAASGPVGELGGAAGAGGLSDAAQPGFPGLEQPPQAHPVPGADKPVGFLYNPVVPGPGPDPEDGWCPACRFYPSPAVLQPRRHDCVCNTCRDTDGIVCPVCSNT